MYMYVRSFTPAVVSWLILRSVVILHLVNCVAMFIQWILINLDSEMWHLHVNS